MRLPPLTSPLTGQPFSDPFPDPPTLVRSLRRRPPLCLLDLQLGLGQSGPPRRSSRLGVIQNLRLPQQCAILLFPPIEPQRQDEVRVHPVNVTSDSRSLLWSLHSTAHSLLIFGISSAFFFSFFFISHCTFVPFGITAYRKGSQFRFSRPQRHSLVPCGNRRRAKQQRQRREQNKSTGKASKQASKQAAAASRSNSNKTNKQKLSPCNKEDAASTRLPQYHPDIESQSGEEK